MAEHENSDRELMGMIETLMRRNNQLYLENRSVLAENRLLRNANRNLVITGQKMAKELRVAKCGKCPTCPLPKTATVRDFFFCPNLTTIGEH